MWRVLKKTISEFVEDNCMQMAAALAYYTLFSLPALLVVVISLVGLTGLVSEESVNDRLQEEIRSVVGDAGATQVQTMIRNVNEGDNSFWGTIIGTIAVLFGSTGVMVQLHDALNEAWDVDPEKQSTGVIGFLLKRLLSLGMILAFSVLMLLSLIVSTLLSRLSAQINPSLPGDWTSELLIGIDTLITFAVVTTMFAVMYRFLPDRDVAWRHVWLGATVTGAMFIVSKFGMAIYLSHSEIASTYGAAGALALILLWVYYSSIVFLLGAEFTQVWARRHEA